MALQGGGGKMLIDTRELAVPGGAVLWISASGALEHSQGNKTIIFDNPHQ